MALSQILTSHIQKAATALFDISLEKIELQATRREFEGDITMVIFPLLKLIKGNPADLGNKIGQYLIENSVIVDRFNVVGGFLNIVISDAYYIDYFNGIKAEDNFGTVAPVESGKAVMVEFASPNTNKPLHLGHVRNVLLGYSVANIIEASGKKVYKTQVVNDRGIHICKSMLAWEKFAPAGSDGEKETPLTTLDPNLKKGDKLVGKYYVEFEKAFQAEYTDWLETPRGNYEFLKDKNTPLAERLSDDNGEIYIPDSENPYLTEDEFIAINWFSDEGERKIFKHNFKDKYFNNISQLGAEVKSMLLKWEANDPDVKALWAKMNGWVYKGFEETYKNIGVDFDSYYYESDTYLLGKDVVADGLEKGVFFKKEDGSVWIDLTPDGLDEKLVLRKDGTSVYITQDIGTAIQRVKDFPDVGGMVYTVGNEQDYHFKVLFLILKKLGFDWATNLYHLSYGMVDLPSGKMKSREGTVVDADDLMAEMTDTAQKISEELGKLEGYSDEEKLKLYKIIGLGALKYQILRVDPKKRILFDPKESIDFNGDSGPFIQMSYVRTRAILRKADFDISATISNITLHPKEKELLKQLELFSTVIQNAATQYSPALIANYAYELSKEFSSFYQNVPVLGAETEDEKVFRIQLSKKVGETIKSAFGLLGIEVPERM